MLNTNPYTYLGNRPLDLSHAATLDRGLVAVTFRTMKATAILRSLGRRAARRRRRADAPTLDEQIDLDHLVIEHDTPFPYQLDGDYLGEIDRLEFDHVPDAVRLVCRALTIERRARDVADGRPSARSAQRSARAARMTSGTSVQMPSMPQPASSTNARRVVARPAR